jgi:hypothetical protein
MVFVNLLKHKYLDAPYDDECTKGDIFILVVEQ